MIGTKTKKFSFGTIIKQDDLMSLNNFISSEYKNIKYSIHTKNNINYDLENYGELISYENYSDSQIKWIRVEANKNIEDKHFIYSDLRLFISEYKVEYEVRNSSENDILCISDKIDKIVYRFKSPHNWTTTLWGSILVNMIILSPLIFFTSKIPKSLESFLPWNYILFYAVIIGLGELLAVIRMYLYPKTVFLIGEQIKIYKKKKNIRKTLTGILITIIVGLLTNYFANLIF